MAHIEKARPYFEALEIANKAQKECQSAATAFQRANGIHAAAKETIALAEERFLTNSSNWQFDNAWQGEYLLSIVYSGAKIITHPYFISHM